MSLISKKEVLELLESQESPNEELIAKIKELTTYDQHPIIKQVSDAISTGCLISVELKIRGIEV